MPIARTRGSVTDHRERPPTTPFPSTLFDEIIFVVDACWHWHEGILRAARLEYRSLETGRLWIGSNIVALNDSVTFWMDRLRDGDGDAAQRLWERYFERLVQLANARLPRGLRREFDEEDVALSAFDSLCRGARKGVFPNLADRNNLWSLLVVITARKALQKVRKFNAAKRGGGDVRGESVFHGANEQLAGIEGVIGQEPSPEFTASVSEEFASLLALLPDEELKQLAVMKMEGYTNQEIADHLDCGLRTIERRLGLIRDLWRVRS